MENKNKNNNSDFTEEEKAESLRISNICVALMRLSFASLQLKQLGISHEALSFVGVGIQKIANELKKLNTDWQFNHIVNGLKSDKDSDEGSFGNENS